ncbi:hypothetical protein [Isoptericola sp. NPDC057653]|uniref:hypothetical protein n=1 Tax=Isoptericola sp. NPDC057653 TaxID=3346195 RepID=UPI00369272CD
MTIDDTVGSGDDARPLLGTVLGAHARGYAQAIRLQLADLGPEVVDELTDGLEADLAEAFSDAAAPLALAGSDSGDDVALDLAAHFGPAQAYAAELRAAAGLPAALPAAAGRAGRRSFAARRALLADRWRRAWHPVTSTPQWERLRVLGRELRPAWWVARGWVVGALLVAWFTWSTDGSPSLVPGNFGELMIMAGSALVSVQWARGRWLPGRWQHRLTVAASVVAVLAVPAVASATHDQSVFGTQDDANAAADGYSYGADTVSYGDGYTGDDGVWVEGRQVANLFVYDAQGKPLRDVQVFDDRGRPVRTVPSGGVDQTWTVPDVPGSWYFRPATAEDGRQRWNVYPMRAVPDSEMEWSDDADAFEPPVGVQPQDMPWPFLQAPTSVGDPAAEDGADEAEGAAQDQPEQKGGAPATDAPSSGTGTGTGSKGARESSSAGAATDARTSSTVAAGR